MGQTAQNEILIKNQPSIEADTGDGPRHADASQAHITPLMAPVACSRGTMFRGNHDPGEP